MTNDEKRIIEEAGFIEHVIKSLYESTKNYIQKRESYTRTDSRESIKRKILLAREELLILSKLI